MNSNMVKPEKFDHLHLVYHFTVPLIISRKFDSVDSWNIEIVLNALKTEITAREKTVLVFKQGENVRDEYFREPLTGSTLLNHQEKSISCLFCKKPHKSQNC